MWPSFERVTKTTNVEETQCIETEPQSLCIRLSPLNYLDIRCIYIRESQPHVMNMIIMIFTCPPKIYWTMSSFSSYDFDAVSFVVFCVQVYQKYLDYPVDWRFPIGRGFPMNTRNPGTWRFSVRRTFLVNKRTPVLRWFPRIWGCPLNRIFGFRS